MLAIPLLVVSIIISVYLGTICPAQDHIQEANLRTVAFFALFVSEIALLWPVYLEALEGVQ